MDEPTTEDPQASATIRTPETARKPERDKDESTPQMSDELCAIHQARFEIEDAHRLAQPSNDDERTEFDKLKSYLMRQLAELEKLDAEGLESNLVESRANDIKNNKAYFKSWGQLRAEAPSLVSELQEWRVPESSRASLEQRAQASILAAERTTPAELHEARATYVDLLDTHQYWNGYIDWYIKRMHCASGTLLGVMIVSLLIALGLLWNGKMLLGMLVAGVAGASVSLLMSLPPISVFGDTMGLWSRILYRYGVGIVGTAVGCGLLALGVLNILPNDLDFNGLINNQSTASAKTPPAPPQPLQTPPPPRVDAGPAPEPPPMPGPQPEVAPPAPREREPHHPPARPHPSPRAVAILLAIGLLLGFTERAMGSFESQLFPEPTPPVPPGPKPLA